MWQNRVMSRIRVLRAPLPLVHRPPASSLITSSAQSTQRQRRNFRLSQEFLGSHSPALGHTSTLSQSPWPGAWYALSRLANRGTCQYPDLGIIPPKPLETEEGQFLKLLGPGCSGHAFRCRG